MELSEREMRRRNLLAAGVVSWGGFGFACACYPLLASLAPSERALAEGGPVDFDTSGLAEGALATVAWRGRPVWVLHRSPAMLASLAGHDAQLVDPASHQSEQPAYCANAVRARRAPFLVVTALCTHLGCVPAFRPEAGAPDLGASWPGGFYCPCHGSRFDLAGRVFRNVPAPRNLAIPPYTYMAGGQLRIGQDDVR